MAESCVIQQHSLLTVSARKKQDGHLLHKKFHKCTESLVVSWGTVNQSNVPLNAMCREQSWWRMLAVCRMHQHSDT